MPYYHLFNSFDDEIYEFCYDNVIVLSSFSKSMGLSGFRIGYVATKNKELYDTMHIRSLYKYNSISNVPQYIINSLLTTEKGMDSVIKYQYHTRKDIRLNIEYLVKNNLLFDKYPSVPVGPFAIINKTFDELIDNQISSVPLSKFSLEKHEELDKFSRISVAVKHELFKNYFDKIK